MSPRRFSLAPLLFLALWTVWFLVPPTRDGSRNQWRARFAPTPAAALNAASAPASDNSRDAALVRALDLNKVDAGGNLRRHALEQLGRRFPEDADICAAQIVASVDELRLSSVRQPGPSSSANPNWSVMLSPNPLKTPSPELLKSWFAATGHGTRLEPNNTFWDWAQIIGLLAAQRDDEVWPVLRAASRKTQFDDHVNEGALARLRLRRQQQVMSPIAQIGIGASTLFPHYAPMREAARQLSDNASGLRIRGGAANQKQALEGMRDFALMARVMRRESKSTIGSLVGTAIESIALYGGGYLPTLAVPPKKPRIGTRVSTYASSPWSLLFFARRMGRNDIAARLGSQWTELGKWRAKTTGPTLTNSLLMGIRPRDIVVAQAGDWFGSLILAGMPTLLAVAVLCSLLLRFVPVLRRESEVQPSPLSWVGGALLSIATLVVLSSMGLYGLWNTWRTGATGFIDLLLAPLSGVYAGPGGATGVPVSWQNHFPAVLGLFAALWLASLWDARRRGQVTLGTRLRGLFHAPEDGMALFDLSPLLALTGTLGAFFLISFGVIGFLIVPLLNENFLFLHDYAGLFLLGFVVVWTLPYLFRLRTPESRAFALIMVRRLAWGQLLFLTVVWGLLWLVAMPSQRRFEAGFTRQLQVGEFQLIRKQVGL